MKILLYCSLLAVGFSQTVVNIPSLTVSSDGTAAVNAWLCSQISSYPSTLANNIDASSITIRVEDGTGYNGSTPVKIDSEVMIVTGKSGRDLTVTRGAFGSVASPHAGRSGGTLGAQVALMKYKDFKDLFVQHIKAVVGQIMEADTSSPVNVAQDAVIATAKAAKEAAKSAVIQ
jgi:hypothetical protein